jgi:aldose sugar dehydrogenase
MPMHFLSYSMPSLARFVAGGILLTSISLPMRADPSAVNRLIADDVVTEQAQVRVVQLVSGLEHPWAMAFLPDGRMLVTERPGRMVLVSGDQVTRLRGLPDIDSEEDQRTAPQGGNQGGLLDVAVHPDYARNGWIYFTYSSPGDADAVIGDDDKSTGTALARARLGPQGDELVDLEVLYVQAPRSDPGRHYGSRIVFPGDGTVIFSIGDRGLRYPSQDLTHPAGSMIRLTEDGRAPEDNPFVGQAPGNLRPEIYSFGHRNNQGLAIHPETGELWTTEHGPRGGDLLHRVEAGKNYGWPQVAYGVEYSTAEPIGIGREAPGVERPVHWWSQPRAPSGLAIYSGQAFPGWRGNLLAGFLLEENISRLVVEDGRVVHEEVLLGNVVGRIRDVREGPDGLIYLATDEADGGIYRIEPVQATGLAAEREQP